ncbi:MAG: hypothetical protein OSB10_05975 [Planctomycetota bacterium]|nr:hypothetical protein [Planctomycetota bacterium]
MNTSLRSDLPAMASKRQLLLLLLVVGLAVFLAGPTHEILHGDAHGEACPMARTAHTRVP